MTLPVAEILKRFLALDFVFILGISVSYGLRFKRDSACHLRPDALVEAGAIGGDGGVGKGGGGLGVKSCVLKAFVVICVIRSDMSLVIVRDKIGRFWEAVLMQLMAV